jgi:ArsR family transcriptional regulator, zinc-responsive transcriptional repressor
MTTSAQAPSPDAEALATMDTMAQLFKALADPTRLRILHVLAAEEKAAGEIARAVGLSASATSHQLSYLYASRIVRRRRQGRSIYYALDDDHVRELFAQALEHATHA